MNIKPALSIVCLVVLIATLFYAAFSAEISVGVKEGDWIEYQVTTTGTVPAIFDVEWAKFAVIAVEGKTINVDITLRYSNGTEEMLSPILNLETGQIGDAYIIPANLNSGDSFPDQNQGTTTINGVGERICAGAKRGIVYVTTYTTTRCWDRSTGVLVEATSTYPDFSLISNAKKTNMWRPQILGLDPTFFIILIIVAVVAVLAIVLILTMRNRSTF